MSHSSAQNATQKCQKVFVHVPSEIAAHDVQKLLFCCLILLLSFVLFLTVTVRSPIFKNPGTANALATKMYEERLKLPQRDPLDDAAMKQRFGENMGQLLDPNHASILKSAAAAGQASGQVLHGAAGAMSPQIQSRNPQLPGSTPDIKTEMNPVLNPRAAGPEGSLIGIPGSNQGGNNLTLKGWPLTEFDFRGHDSAFKDRYLQLQNVRVSFIPTDKRDIHDLGPMEEVVSNLVRRVYSAPTQMANVFDMQERTIDGKNYYTFEYALTSPNFSRAAFATIAIGNGRYYTLIVGANERRWRRVRNQLKVVADSFKVLDI